jgi:hypothetical protein
MLQKGNLNLIYSNRNLNLELTKGWKEAEAENPPVQAPDGLVIKGMSEENLL